MFRLVIIFSLVWIGAAEARNNLYVRNNSSILTSYTGTKDLANINLGFNPKTGVFENSPKMVKSFTILLGPKSQAKGCVLAISNYNDFPFTGIVQAYPNMPVQQATRLESSELSTDPNRPGWLKHVFTVNGGLGAYATGILTVFKHRPYVETCMFELYYEDGITVP